MLPAAWFMRASVPGIIPRWVISRGPLNTSDSRSPLKKNGLLISPDMKKKNSFLSLILMRPSNYFIWSYVIIHWSSLTVTLISIQPQKHSYFPAFFLLIIPLLQTSSCLCQHVLTLLVFIYASSNLFLFPPTSGFLKLLKTLAFSSYCSDSAERK